MKYNSEEDFRRAIVKMAMEGGDNEDSTVSGKQNDDTPELLQPDEGSGSGSRGEHETFSEGAEKAHSDNREGKGGYLEQAFDGFQQAARQDGAELSNLLDNFGPKAIVSRAAPEAAQTKISSVQIEAFTDELQKIAVGNTPAGRKTLWRLIGRTRKAAKGKIREYAESGGSEKAWKAVEKAKERHARSIRGAARHDPGWRSMKGIKGDDPRMATEIGR